MRSPSTQNTSREVNVYFFSDCDRRFATPICLTVARLLRGLDMVVLVVPVVDPTAQVLAFAGTPWGLLRVTPNLRVTPVGPAWLAWLLGRP